MKYGQIWMKKYAERSKAKKKPIKIKRGPKKLNFGASKPGVRGGPGPLGPPPGSASGQRLRIKWNFELTVLELTVFEFGFSFTSVFPLSAHVSLLFLPYRTSTTCITSCPGQDTVAVSPSQTRFSFMASVSK